MTAEVTDNDDNKAVDILNKVCKMWVDGEVTGDDLYSTRDSLVNEGLESSSNPNEDGEEEEEESENDGGFEDSPVETDA